MLLHHWGAQKVPVLCTCGMRLPWQCGCTHTKDDMHTRWPVPSPHGLQEYLKSRNLLRERTSPFPVPSVQHRCNPFGMKATAPSRLLLSLGRIPNRRRGIFAFLFHVKAFPSLFPLPGLHPVFCAGHQSPWALHSQLLLPPNLGATSGLQKA